MRVCGHNDYNSAVSLLWFTYSIPRKQNTDALGWLFLSNHNVSKQVASSQLNLPWRKHGGLIILLECFFLSGSTPNFTYFLRLLSFYTVKIESTCYEMFSCKKGSHKTNNLTYCYGLNVKGPHRFVCLSSWWYCFGSLLNLFETARGSGSLGDKLREWDRWLLSSFPFPGDMANPLHTPPMPCFPQSETEIKQVCLKLLLLRSPWQGKWLTCGSIFHWFCLEKKMFSISSSNAIFTRWLKPFSTTYILNHLKTNLMSLLLIMKLP